MTLKRSYLKVSLLTLTFGALALASLLTLSSVSAKQTKQATNTQAACDAAPHVNHVTVIRDNSFSPTFLAGSRCDTLTIVNYDSKERLIAFGLHEQHVPYGGVSERLLLKDESFTIRLAETGTFRVHDHLQQDAQATFTVSP